MICTYSLTNSMKNKFQKLHRDVFNNKRVKNFSMIEFYHDSHNLTKDHETLLERSVELLKMEGITDYDEKKFCIDFHQRNCFEKNDNKHNWSVWHVDDYSVIGNPVYTILYYVRIDKTVKGGELLFDTQNKFSFFSSNTFQCKELEVSEGDIVCLKGDLLHKPSPTWGFGCRDLIVVFIKRGVRNL